MPELRLFPACLALFTGIHTVFNAKKMRQPEIASSLVYSFANQWIIS